MNQNLKTKMIKSTLTPERIDQIMKSSSFETIEEYLIIQQLYDAGIKEVRTKLEILDAEFKTRHDHNPIHHIESRLKAPDSIVKKALSKNIPLSYDAICENILDIAGVRVICNYVSDIYEIAELLIKQSDIKLIEKKDYIQDPKPSGYRSLHLVIEIPIFLAEKVQPVFVEIQIRTIAMDFWASLEHKLKYKTNNTIPEHIKKELQDCAASIAFLDARMENIHNELNNKNT